MVELWRPAPRGGEVPIRRMPRFEPLGLAQFSGVIGVRRPQDWAGRLGPADTEGLIADSEFARAWGPLPSGPGTLAGASRFRGPAGLAIGTGPPRNRPRVSPAVRVNLVPGRLEFQADAAWTDDGGSSRDVRLRIPGGLRLTRVDAAGLTDWSRTADDSLSLRFDGEDAPQEKAIRIEGFVPIDGDPMATGPVRSEVDVPWPTWPSAIAEAGTLVVTAASSVAFKLDPGPGVVVAESASAGSGSLRVSYQIPALRAPGRLRWTAEPPGVIVRLQSLLTLHPDSAEWSASARYTVPWGPSPPIRLHLPTPWADASVVEVTGTSVAPKIERMADQTTWTFTPDPPIWGGLRVLVRGSRPRTPGGSLAFPDTVPLGRPTADRVDSYLGFADASGRPPIVEGSADLQPIDASRWNSDDLPPPPAAPFHVYRVMKDGWSLRLIDPAGPRLQGREAVTISADVSCTLGADGAVLGRASYDLDGRDSSFLAVNLPPGAEPLGATVDGSATIPRLDRPGRIVVPLAEGGSSRVVVSWRGDCGTAARDGLRTLPLPFLDREGTPTLVTVSAPEGSRLFGTGVLKGVTPTELEVTRSEGKARVLVDRFANFDRSSHRDRSALLAALIRFEIQARSAERSAAGPARPPEHGP